MKPWLHHVNEVNDGYEKIIRKSRSLLEYRQTQAQREKKCLKHVLKKLRKHEEKLNARLQNELDEQVIDPSFIIAKPDFRIKYSYIINRL